MASPRVVLRDLFGAEQDFSALSWQPFREGVQIARIYGDGLAGPSAALLRYEPGAQLPPHRHVDYEQIIVLSGSQRDEHGTYPAGTCLIHAPATTHQVSSDEGCVVLAIWNSPVAFDD
jgi:anti-sigma factor ChrR (cupin superfamily)